MINYNYFMQVLVLTHFPRFLGLLEEEIFSSNSPIWDPEYKPVPPNHLQSILDNKGDLFSVVNLLSSSVFHFYILLNFHFYLFTYHHIRSLFIFENSQLFVKY